jgi:hypothetical protein
MNKNKYLNNKWNKYLNNKWNKYLKRTFREHSAELLPTLKWLHNVGKNTIQKKTKLEQNGKNLGVCVAVHFRVILDDNPGYRPK